MPPLSVTDVLPPTDAVPELAQQPPMILPENVTALGAVIATDVEPPIVVAVPVFPYEPPMILFTKVPSASFGRSTITDVSFVIFERPPLP